MELSKYGKKLDAEGRKIYIEKFSLFANKDPYILKYSDQCLPTNVDYLKVINYLLHSKHTSTNNKFEAVKALGGDKLYEAGWVQSLMGCKQPNCCLVLSKVLHSQSLNLPALQVWIAVDQDGFVTTAHCTCVAGLGECCSHIGATLFALESVARKFQEDKMVSVTDVKAYWKVPSCKSKMQVSCEQIKWRNAVSKHPKKEIHPATKADAITFLKGLKSVGCEVAAMATFDEFNAPSSSMAPHVECEYLSHMYMANLYKPKHDSLDSGKLKELGNEIVFTLSLEQVKLAQNETVRQSSCDYWHKLRIGRITASIFKQAARTKIEKVSMSLLKKICYGQNEIFSPAIKYGCRHESDGIDYVLSSEQKNHINLNILKTGIVIDHAKSYYACSPDGIWKCDCCGEFPVEVKCPFCLKDGDVASFLNKADCPIIQENGEWVINKRHQYFWQIQMQCAILNSSHCFFCIFSPNFKKVLKVQFDRTFFEAEICKTDIYFHNVVLLELLGRYYTNRIAQN